MMNPGDIAANLRFLAGAHALADRLLSEAERDLAAHDYPPEAGLREGEASMVLALLARDPKCPLGTLPNGPERRALRARQRALLARCGAIWSELEYRGR